MTTLLTAAGKRQTRIVGNLIRPYNGAARIATDNRIIKNIWPVSHCYRFSSLSVTFTQVITTNFYRATGAALLG